jgi:hypothetical protein
LPDSSGSNVGNGALVLCRTVPLIPWIDDVLGLWYLDKQVG